MSTHFAGGRCHITFLVAVQFCGLNFPEKTLDLLLDLPLAVDAGRDDRGAKEQQPQGASGHHTMISGVRLDAFGVVEAATRHVHRLHAPGPLDVVDHFVLLRV